MTKKELSQKVDELFRYRHIPELITLSGIKEASEFSKQLKMLQIAIYYLDHHLESNWNIKKGDLKKYWNDIFEAMTSLGIFKKDAPVLCKQIAKYQSHELNMRNGKWPTDYKFQFLYYYKSCDVKLIRKLIYNRQPALNKKIKETDWRFYDYVTEINDDVEDVFEDIHTINGNRFLISILQQGTAKTQKEFLSELRLIKKQMNVHFGGKKRTPETKELIKWTNTRLEESIQLIKKQLSLKKINSVSKAIISKHLLKE